MMDGCMAVVTTKFQPFFLLNTITWWGISLEFLGCILFLLDFPAVWCQNLETWHEIFLLFLLCTRKIIHSNNEHWIKIFTDRKQQIWTSYLHFQTCSFFRGKVTNPPQVFFGLYSSKTTEAHDVNAFQGCRRQLPWPSGRCCRGRRPCGTRCPGGWAAPGGARGADVAGTLSKSCQRLGRKPQGCLRMWRKLPKRLSLKGLFGVSWMGVVFFAANIYEMKLNQTGMIECLKWAWLCWFLIVFVAGLLTKNACRPRSLDFNSSQFANRFVLWSRWHVHSARLEQGSKAGPSVHYTLHGRGASTGTPGRRGCQWQTSCATSSMHLQVGKRGRPGWVECWQEFGLCLFLGWDNEILVVWKVRVCLKNLES